MAKNRRQKVSKSDFESRFSSSKILQIFLKKILLKNINLGATFLFLSILCSIKIERFLFLKFLKKLAFFDSYFWPFNKTHEKIVAIFVISAITASIWNVFIKFRWLDEKFTPLLAHVFCLQGCFSNVLKYRVGRGPPAYISCIESELRHILVNKSTKIWIYKLKLCNLHHWRSFL